MLIRSDRWFAASVALWPVAQRYREFARLEHERRAAQEMADSGDAEMSAMATDEVRNLDSRIEAEGFDTFSTVLFFENDRRNLEDTVYNKLSAASRESLTLSMSADGEDVVGNKQIVLRGKARQAVLAAV